MFSTIQQRRTTRLASPHQVNHGRAKYAFPTTLCTPAPWTGIQALKPYCFRSPTPRFSLTTLQISTISLPLVSHCSTMSQYMSRWEHISKTRMDSICKSYPGRIHCLSTPQLMRPRRNSGRLMIFMKPLSWSLKIMRQLGARRLPPPLGEKQKSFTGRLQESTP